MPTRPVAFRKKSGVSYSPTNFSMPDSAIRNAAWDVIFIFGISHVIMSSMTGSQKLKKRNQSHVFTKIKELTGHSHENLKKAFDAELLNSDDYYAMYDYSYFLNQTEIEEHDNRFSERGLFRSLETFIPDSIQYTIENTFAPINEMEKDLNDHAATFFNVAYQAYKDYVSNIETLLDAVGLGLSPMEENESIHDYLSRMLTSSI